MKIKPEIELSTSDWQLVHQHRASKALLRKKNLTPQLRARLEVKQPQLEAEAKARGIAAYLPGWREYPDGSGEKLSFRFGVGVRKDGSVNILNTPPTTAKRRRRARRADGPAASRSGGEMLDAVVAELEQRMSA